MDIATASIRLSVRQSCYLLLNHLTKSNQIWCVSCSHGLGVQQHKSFLPRSLGPWRGARRSSVYPSVHPSVTPSPPKLNHYTKSNQILCVSCTFLAPPPGALGRGKKGQISLNFNSKFNFKDFLTKLCLPSHN